MSAPAKIGVKLSGELYDSLNSGDMDAFFDLLPGAEDEDLEEYGE